MGTFITTPIVLISFNGFVQKNTKEALKQLDAKTRFYGGIAQTIWEYTKMGYKEVKSVALLQKTLAFTATTKALFSNTKLIDEVKVKFLERRGAEFKYIPLLCDRKPALNNRD